MMRPDGTLQPVPASRPAQRDADERQSGQALLVAATALARSPLTRTRLTAAPARSSSSAPGRSRKVFRTSRTTAPRVAVERLLWRPSRQREPEAGRHGGRSLPGDTDRAQRARHHHRPHQPSRVRAASRHGSGVPVFRREERRLSASTPPVVQMKAGMGPRHP